MDLSKPINATITESTGGGSKSSEPIKPVKNIESDSINVEQAINCVSKSGGEAEQTETEFYKKPFHDPELFLITFCAWFTGSSKTHQELIKILEPTGSIRVINTNYGSKSQEGWEFKQKHGAKKKKIKIQYCPDGVTPLPVNVRKQRKTEGYGGCLNSSVEAVISPTEEDMTPELKAIMERRYEENATVNQKWIKKNKTKKIMTETQMTHYWYVRVFPTLGKIQVYGSVDKNALDGKMIANIWIKYMHQLGVCDDMENPPRMYFQRPSLYNYKIWLNSPGDNIKFNLHTVIKLVTAIKNAEEIKESDIPFRIHVIKPVGDGQGALFTIIMKTMKKIQIPEDFDTLEEKYQQRVMSKIESIEDEQSTKCATIKMWFSGKINILNTQQNETNDSIDLIYKFFTELTQNNWKRIIKCVR
jgi:hypothetical protein